MLAFILRAVRVRTEKLPNGKKTVKKRHTCYVQFFQTPSEIGRSILDNKWHNIMVAISSEADSIAFYYDGDHIGTNRFVG